MKVTKICHCDVPILQVVGRSVAVLVHVSQPDKGSGTGKRKKRATQLKVLAVPYQDILVRCVTEVIGKCCCQRKKTGSRSGNLHIKIACNNLSIRALGRKRIQSIRGQILDSRTLCGRLRILKNYHEAAKYSRRGEMRGGEQSSRPRWDTAEHVASEGATPM